VLPATYEVVYAQAWGAPERAPGPAETRIAPERIGRRR
jgi:hypothetical protein